MSFDVINKVPYLKTTRFYGGDQETLTEEINIAYVDIANSMNDRTIGLYPVEKPAIGGEHWFIDANKKQQNLRQVYSFSAAGNIAHGLDVNSITNFTKCSGSFTDGTNNYGVVFGSNTAIAGQISFYVTNTNIVVLSGAGAPTITFGIIWLEWLSHA